MAASQQGFAQMLNQAFARTSVLRQRSDSRAGLDWVRRWQAPRALCHLAGAAVAARLTGTSMIAPTDSISIAEELATQHDAKSIFMPLHDRIRTFEDAYAVKDAFVDRQLKKYNADICGYKIGLTALKLQEMMNIAEPTEGEVLSTRVHTTPFTARISEYVHLGIESEICVVLGRDLKAGCSRADVAASLSAIHAAYELIDDRAADYTAMNAISLIADNSWNEAVVLGDAGDAALDLRSRKGRLTCNGTLICEGSTRDAIGHTLDMVVWLAGHLSKRGKYLKTGQLVMTGSLMPPIFPKAGEEYIFEVEDLAPVVLHVE